LFINSSRKNNSLHFLVGNQLFGEFFHDPAAKLSWIIVHFFERNKLANIPKLWLKK
jgi:hypothetical protein